MPSSPPQPTSTILITGGNGSLGSAIAVQIAKSHPGKHHLVLTARKLSDDRTISTSANLRTLNASFEFQVLDLSSLEDITSFAAKLGERVRKGEIPPFAGGGVILSAAMLTFVKDRRTKDGWNEVYGINVLAQVLLIRELLLELGDATVVIIASATHGIGDVKFFSVGKPADGAKNKAEETLGLGEAMKRYGSSKLLLIMSSYVLQRKLNAVGPGNSSTQIVNLDPGGMSGDSHLGARASWIIRSMMLVLGIFAPVVRWLRKDAFNPPEGPAKVIAELLGDGNAMVGGRYLILDNGIKSSPVSLDEKLQDEVWARVCRDLNLSPEI